MPGSLRLTKIKFYSGPSPNESPLEAELGHVLILVGPNNSGKSITLKEIERFCRGNDRPERKRVDSIDIDFSQDFDETVKQIKEFQIPFPPERGPSPGDILSQRLSFDPNQQRTENVTTENGIRGALELNNTHFLSNFK
jgi:hypothetical protein